MIVRWVSRVAPSPELQDVQVWIDVAKFNAEWRLDLKDWVGPGGAGPQSDSLFRYNRFGSWLLCGQNAKAVEAPWAGANAKGLYFTDGRHRFAWMRDHGVTDLPIDVEQGEVDFVARRFGTPERASVVILSK
jgi:hypothetical protein